MPSARQAAVQPYDSSEAPATLVTIAEVTLRHTEGPLVTKDGATLWLRQWEPDGEARAAIGLLHGLGEHSGRYAHLARRLTDAGHALAAIDLRGHGRSTGRRGDTRLQATLDDVDRLLGALSTAHTGVPLFLYGHSLGALVVLTYVIRRRPVLAGVVLSAPPLRNALRGQRAKVLIARVLGRLLPGLTLPTGLDAAALSRDPAVVAAYLADPLVHRSASLGFARDSLAATDAVDGTTALGVPLLIIHGAADRLAYIDGSRQLAQRLRGDVTCLEYAGLVHEPHNEPERDRVIDDVIAWLQRHLVS